MLNTDVIRCIKATFNCLMSQYGNARYAISVIQATTLLDYDTIVSCINM